MLESINKEALLGLKVLGQGQLFKAYLSEDKAFVYKVITTTNIVLKAHQLPERNARLWNEFYLSAYSQKYSYYATAALLIPKYKNILLINNPKILKVPFINGELMSDNDLRDNSHKVINEFRKIGRVDTDILGPENYRKIDDDILPIDFDMVRTIERSKSEGSLSIFNR